MLMTPSRCVAASAVAQTLLAPERWRVANSASPIIAFIGGIRHAGEERLRGSLPRHRALELQLARRRRCALMSCSCASEQHKPVLSDHRYVRGGVGHRVPAGSGPASLWTTASRRSESAQIPPAAPDASRVRVQASVPWTK
jgi:hypothetical protein